MFKGLDVLELSSDLEKDMTWIFNRTMPIPPTNLPDTPCYFFTEYGRKTFQEDIAAIQELYEESGIFEIRSITIDKDSLDPNDILYEDDYQVGIRANLIKRLDDTAMLTERSIPRLKGYVHHFNGIFGLAIGENGQKYYLHKSEFDTADRSACSMNNCLSKSSPKRPVTIEFDVQAPEDERLNPRAIRIRIVKPAGFVPEQTPDGYWLAADNGTDDKRCSSCGHTAPFAYKFCPHCGVPMTRKPAGE